MSGYKWPLDTITFQQLFEVEEKSFVDIAKLCNVTKGTVAGFAFRNGFSRKDVDRKKARLVELQEFERLESEKKKAEIQEQKEIELQIQNNLELQRLEEERLVQEEKKRIKREKKKFQQQRYREKKRQKEAALAVDKPTKVTNNKSIVVKLTPKISTTSVPSVPISASTPPVPVVVQKIEQPKPKISSKKNPQDPVGCKYITGDVKANSDWFYCQKPTTSVESSWCSEHKKIVYTSSTYIPIAKRSQGQKS